MSVCIVLFLFSEYTSYTKRPWRHNVLLTVRKTCWEMCRVTHNGRLHAVSVISFVTADLVIVTQCARYTFFGLGVHFTTIRVRGSTEEAYLSYF